MLHELNLMDWRQSQLYRRKRLLYGVWLCGGCLWLMVQSVFYFEWHKQQTDWQQSEQQINAQLNEQQQHLREWELRRQHAQQELRKLAHAEQWIAHSQLPQTLMSVLVSAVPRGIYLEEIRLTEQQVVIRGLSRHPAAMNRFIQRLRQASSIGQLDILSVTDQTPGWGSQFNTFQLRLVMTTSMGDSVSAMASDTAITPVAVMHTIKEKDSADVH
ncbi:PilN domain-containing protein [Vibrio spartinae]|uniref:Fimbrial assembly protein (PilN) n=1 Tax=Vibrio spartinae TaxID=1918945 RepID=A0ABX6QV34_9VIBR|nr:PilN domain-containing protein [Vibrio spartinae]QMV13094.1 Fimbrial assembly protein (PilN) [Vibrio spartinae]